MEVEPEDKMDLIHFSHFFGKPSVDIMSKMVPCSVVSKALQNPILE
jgi:hypothetical protein